MEAILGKRMSLNDNHNKSLRKVQFVGRAWNLMYHIKEVILY